MRIGENLVADSLGGDVKRIRYSKYSKWPNIWWTFMVQGAFFVEQIELDFTQFCFNKGVMGSAFQKI